VKQQKANQHDLIPSKAMFNVVVNTIESIAPEGSMGVVN